MRVRRLLALTTAALVAGAAGLAGLAPAGAAPAAPQAAAAPDLGPNVVIFDPTMATSAIQARVDAIRDAQVDAEMGTARWALLFLPGTYGSVAEPLVVQVGYYTEVAGLGASPSDVTINGHVDVYNRCLAPDNCIALNNFWRSVSNLTINVTGLDGCRASANFWAASQASPMRRVDVRGGNLSLMDYCTAGPQYASGGFIADSRTGFVINGSQQQYIVRNSTLGGWSNGVWNQVFAGVEGAPPTAFPGTDRYTTLDTTPLSREKPYLFVDAGGRWQVFVPAAQRDSRGTTWAGGVEPGRAVPLSAFLVASPRTSVRAINEALARGRHLLLLPGVYDVARSIEVKRPGTVVLGLGVATLTSAGGAVPLTVADVEGVRVAGLMIDAGPVESAALLRIGRRGDAGHTAARGRPLDPTTLNDVYFRVGGPHPGRTKVALEVNSDDVLLDHLWVWRADHGNDASFGWTVSTAKNGVVVRGDDVTATGFFVEHFQEYNVVWTGERGRVAMFQNELPYDPPDQAAWRHDGVLGWAAYKVADQVRSHELWGGGSYVFLNVDPTIHATRGFEVPVRPGVRLTSLLTVQLGAGTIDHVVNDTGTAADGGVPGGGAGPLTGTPSFVVSFP
jgi:hypothetical protein